MLSIFIFSVSPTDITWTAHEWRQPRSRCQLFQDRTTANTLEKGPFKTISNPLNNQRPRKILNSPQIHFYRLTLFCHNTYKYLLRNHWLKSLLQLNYWTDLTQSSSLLSYIKSKSIFLYNHYPKKNFVRLPYKKCIWVHIIPSSTLYWEKK